LSRSADIVACFIFSPSDPFFTHALPFSVPPYNTRNFSKSRHHHHHHNHHQHHHHNTLLLFQLQLHILCSSFIFLYTYHHWYLEKCL
jgi:hypothetical protein